MTLTKQSMREIPQVSSFRAFVRIQSIVLASALLAGAIGGCAPPPPSTSTSPTPVTGSAAPSQPTIQVVTTFLPITQFTRAVAGNRAQVTQLLPVNAEPHDYQARPADAQLLANAQVLVQNGLEMEAFLKDLIANANNPGLKVIDSSQGIAPITTDSIAGEHGHGATETHGHDHDHGEFNPHIWLDPKRAMRQVENIRDALIAADPGGKAIYTANAAAFIQQLKSLDTEITTALKPYTGKTFIAYHDFAPYFAQSYGLRAEFLVDLPEENPSPADVKRVIDTTRASNLKTLLTEPAVGEAAFSGIAADLKVQVSTFDPLEAGDLNAQTPDYYLKVMRQNLQNLKSAFGRGTTQTRSLVPFDLVTRRMAG